MSAPRMTLVIPTRRRPEVLAQTLESLATADPRPHELIVVDGDEERSAEAVVEAFARRSAVESVRYLPTPPPGTYQRNRGIDAATGDVVAISDDDVEFDPGTFAALARPYEDPAVVGVTGKVIEESVHAVGGAGSRVRNLLPGGGEEGRMTRYGYPRRLVDLETPRDVEFMHGCLLSARREAAAEVRFDESLGGYALAEDEDFSYRLSRRGRLRYVPDAVVRHKNLGLRGQDSRAFNRMVVVNRAYLFRKNFARTPLARAQFALVVAVLAVHRLLNRDLAGVRGLAEGSLEAWRRR